MDSIEHFDDRVRVPDYVGFTIVAGEAVILNMKRGLYFGLDEIGTAIWQSLIERGTAADVVAQLELEYDVDPEQLRRDIRDWMNRAKAAGLIERS